MIVSTLLGLLMFAHAPMPNAALGAGEPSEQNMTFHIEWAGAPVPDYTVYVNEDGTGRYWEGSLPAGDAPPAKPVADLTVTPPTLAKIFAAKPVIQSAACESRAKHIANTGKKTLRHVDHGSVSECIYNYSEDEKIAGVTSVFQAIAMTLQTGEKLKRDHRFDHLGLSADLDLLVSSVKTGYAIEIQNIAPILQSIVDDEEMMSPVRRKATSLLQVATGQTAPSAR